MGAAGDVSGGDGRGVLKHGVSLARVLIPFGDVACLCEDGFGRCLTSFRRMSRLKRWRRRSCGGVAVCRAALCSSAGTIIGDNRSFGSSAPGWVERPGRHTLSYARLVRIPGVVPVLLSVFVGALPIGILTLALLLFAEQRTGSIGVAGVVVAAFGIGNAVGLLVQGRLLDRFPP